MHLKKQKRTTIQRRIIAPLIIIIVLQPIFYFAAFSIGGVFSNLEKNYMEAFGDKTNNRRLLLQNNMVDNWGNIGDVAGLISENISIILRENQADAQKIKVDSALNEAIVVKVAPLLINTLRRNGTTGIFMMLDGIGVPGRVDSYAGIYIRDAEPSTYAMNNNDLLLERGLPEISRNLGIPLDSYWSSAFYFGEKCTSLNCRGTFFEPMEAAATLGDSGGDCGYWNGDFFLNGGADGGAITYSVPIVLEDGTVIGVVGVDIADDYLGKFLSYEELTPERKGAYVIGKTLNGGRSYERIIARGPIEKQCFGHDQPIKIERENEYGFVSLENKVGRSMVGSIETLKLYDEDSFFVGEQWALIGMVNQDDLLYSLNDMKQIFTFVTMLLLGGGLVTALLVAMGVTRPIARLALELKQSDPHKPILLRRVNMEEIDELSESIESLSKSVEASASKISQIITLTGIPLGVYEIEDDSDKVFCSQSLFILLGWEDWNDNSPYVRFEEFNRRFKIILDKGYSEEYDSCKIVLPGDREKWVKIKTSQNDKRTIGAVLDVTKEIEEKLKLEYERDYDVLTNLYNRRAFKKVLHKIFDGGEQVLKTGAMLMFDLDNLKYLNDSFGHDCGDIYIQAFAKCLQKFNEYSAVVGRRSGDEFYVFMYGYETQEEVRRIVGLIWEQIRDAYIAIPGGERYKMRVSGGLAWYPKDAEDSKKLVLYADFAMYNVKHTIKGNLGEFNQAEYDHNAIMLTGSEALNKLIENSMIKYAMQPIVSATNGEIYGYEMLMRPTMAEFESPGEVLRLAAAQSKLKLIETETIFGAMETAKQKLMTGQFGDDVKIFINSISNQVLDHEDLFDLELRYPDILKCVVLEITEDERGDDSILNEKMRFIRKWGGLLAIDDYGAGYNREALLLSTSPDMVKIDISIVRSVDTDENRRSMVQSIIEYVHGRNIMVLAEGVETSEELKTLVSMGVDYLQGYYIGRPSFEISVISKNLKEEIRSVERSICGGYED